LDGGAGAAIKEAFTLALPKYKDEKRDHTIIKINVTLIICLLAWYLLCPDKNL
jgi:hypothetical protein